MPIRAPHPPRVLMGMQHLPLLPHLLPLPRMGLGWRRKSTASTGGSITIARSAVVRASASTGGTVASTRSAAARASASTGGSAEPLQGVRQGHLRAWATASLLQGVRRQEHLRARAAAEPLQDSAVAPARSRQYLHCPRYHSSRRQYLCCLRFHLSCYHPPQPFSKTRRRKVSLFARSHFSRTLQRPSRPGSG